MEPTKKITERSGGGKESNRNHHRENIKEKKATEGKQPKTGKDQTILP